MVFQTTAATAMYRSTSSNASRTASANTAATQDFKLCFLLLLVYFEPPLHRDIKDLHLFSLQFQYLIFLSLRSRLYNYVPTFFFFFHILNHLLIQILRIFISFHYCFRLDFFFSLLDFQLRILVLLHVPNHLVTQRSFNLIQYSIFQTLNYVPILLFI